MELRELGKVLCLGFPPCEFRIGNRVCLQALLERTVSLE